MEHGTFYFEKNMLSQALACLTILMLHDFLSEFYPGKIKLFENQYIVIRWASYLLIIVLILSLGVLDSGQFIYFKF